MGKKWLLIAAALCCLLYIASCRFVEVVDRPGVGPTPGPTLQPSPSPTPNPSEPTPNPSNPTQTPSNPTQTPSEPTPGPSEPTPYTVSPAPTAGSPVQVDTLPIYSVAREEKAVALSFDASWGATYTEQLLDTLDAYGARATFFLVGFWVDEHPDLVREIADRGHAVGNHSGSHPHMSELSDTEIADELNTCQDKIDALIGRPGTLVFRPPYGDYDDEMLAVCAEQGYYSIQWDVDSLDWQGLSASEIEERVLSRVGPGSIVLMHNEGEHTAEALPAILEELVNRGYSFAAIPDLIYKDHYRIDQTGRQQPE